MTDAHDAGFYLKRARAAEAAFGNQAYHRDQHAKILGYWGREASGPGGGGTLRTPLERGGIEPGARITLVPADLPPGAF